MGEEPGQFGSCCREKTAYNLINQIITWICLSMRIMPLLKAACLSLMLSACVAPLLMMSPTSQLMWALLKPLVGFDPNEANLFEQPLIKDRMTAMLGPNYDSTMQLLKTANELQQEGPLLLRGLPLRPGTGCGQNRPAWCGTPTPTSSPSCCKRETARLRCLART